MMTPGDILQRLDGVVRSGSGFSARCPAHEDTRNSLSVSEGEDGRILLHCHAGCTVEAVVQALGLTLADLMPDEQQASVQCTTGDLALHKRLPADFLRQCGLEDRTSKRGTPYVRIPYFLQDGRKAERHRARTSVSAGAGSFWLGEQGKPIVPYGLDKLRRWLAAGEHTLILCEGESDCWTLWHHGLPALGIPGASMTKTLHPSHVEGFQRLVLIQEYGSGGAAFIRGLAERLKECPGEVVVVEMPRAAKDPNALHRTKGEAGFAPAFGALQESAVPLGYWLGLDAGGLEGLEACIAAAASREMAQGTDALESRLIDYAPRIGTLSRRAEMRARQVLKRAGLPQRFISDLLRTAKEEASENDTTIPRFARLLLERDHYARDAGGRLYVYDGKAYRGDGEAHARRALQQVVKDEKSEDLWSRRFEGDVLHYLRSSEDVAQLPETPIKGKLVLENGILDLKTRTLSPHTPDLVTDRLIPIHYNPEAACPDIRRFCAQVLPSDAQHLAGELFAWILMPDNPGDQAAMLRGAGGNGKSIFLEILIRAIGRENICSRELHEFTENRFAAADLYRKLANVAADITSRELESTGRFKALVSGDPLTVERKHEHPFNFRPFAKLLFSANTTPHSKDTSEGFFRRWIVIPFSQTFSGKERIKRSALLERLTIETELSGLLNWALEVWNTVARRGLTISSSMAEAHQVFRMESNPVTAWLLENVEEAAGDFVPCGELLDACKTFARENSYPVPNRQGFGRAVKDCYPAVRIRRPDLGEGRARVYSGIRLRNLEADDEAEDAHSEHTYTPPSSVRDVRDISTYAGREKTRGEGEVCKSPIEKGGENADIADAPDLLTVGLRVQTPRGPGVVMGLPNGNGKVQVAVESLAETPKPVRAFDRTDLQPVAPF